MTTVTPPPPPAPLPPAAPAPLLTVSAAPEVLARLAALPTLEALVVDLPTRNQIVVDSPVGPLTLRTPQALPLAEGAKLTLQVITSVDTQVQVRLIAVDGRPVFPLHAPASNTPQAAVATAGPVQWMISQRPAGIPALLVQAPTAGTGSLAQGQWPVGTELTVRLAALQPPGTGTLGQGGAGQGGVGQSGQPLTPGAPATMPGPPTSGAPAAPAVPAAAAPTGPTPAITSATAPPVTSPQVTGAQVTSPQVTTPTTQPLAPASSLAAAAPAQPAVGQGTPATQAPPPTPAATPVLATLTGTVQPHATGGMPLITTPAGTVALQAAVPLPAGATVVLEVTSAQAPAPLPQAPTAALPGGPAGAALTQAVTLLAATDADAARRLATVMPGPDTRMLTNTVAFAQAAASGDVRAWIGNDALRALERAGPRGAQAARGLSDGLREATKTVRDSGGAEWRTLTMPFGVGGTVDRIHIITRRHGADGEDGEDSGGGKGGQGQRFLIQLDLSRLGALQFDGLYKKRDRRLDLIVRTKTELPPMLRRDLAGIFARSAMALALKGGMTFHVSDRFAGPPLGPDGAAAEMMV